MAFVCSSNLFSSSVTFLSTELTCIDLPLSTIDSVNKISNPSIKLGALVVLSCSFPNLIGYTSELFSFLTITVS